MAQLEGLPIVNATKALYITITKADINKGGVQNPANCAVAKACKAETGTEARVFLGRIYIRRGNHWERYRTPQAIRAEIISFDRAHVFQEGEYYIPPTQASKQTGKRQGSTKGDSERKHKRVHVKPNHKIEGVRSRAYVEP